MLTKWNKVLHFLHFMNILSLNHISEKVVNFVFAASKISTFDEVVGLLSPSTGRCVQFEWPQEICSIFEVGPTVIISCTKSSTQIIPNLPNRPSIISLLVIGVRLPSTLTNPRL